MSKTIKQIAAEARARRLAGNTQQQEPKLSLGERFDAWLVKTEDNNKRRIQDVQEARDALKAQRIAEGYRF